MRRNYLKNIFLSQLQPKGPIEVFESSIGKVKDMELLEEVISSLGAEDIESFLKILAKSTYNLNQSNLRSILLKFPLQKTTYLLLKDLCFTVNDLKEIRTMESSFLLNYCYYREQLQDFVHFELFNNVDISTIQLANLEQPGHCENFSILCYYQILKKLFFNLKNGKITTFNISSFERYLKHDEFALLNNSKKECKKTTAFVLINNLSAIVKDPLLKAILNENGRVNAHSYIMADLVIVNYKQIYNLDSQKKILLQLCQSYSVDGVCTLCKEPAAVVYELNTSQKTNHSPKVSLVNSSETKSTPITNAICLMEALSHDENNFRQSVVDMVESEIDLLVIFKTLLHCSWLRTPKYFKYCLRNYMLMPKKNQSKENGQTAFLPNKTTSYNTEALSETYILLQKLLKLFVMNQENETVAISFFKASSSYIDKAIAVIPLFMTTEKLYFSSFIVLLEAYKKNPYMKCVAKNLINRFNIKFSSILNLILEFMYKKTSVEDEYTQLYDKDYLYVKLGLLSDLFSETPESFINRNIYHIFNTFYPSPYFTTAFVNSNVKYRVINKIIDSSYGENADDVDVLVGLLFQGRFDCLDTFFKPTVNLFIKNCFSHVLFKVKNSYSLKLYNRNTCIYKIMKFVLLQINVPLYFSYLWPYVEFFLNHKSCVCAGHLLDWLQSLSSSKLMSPYLVVPFENIEDFPVISNIESKIYPMLSRYFSSVKIPFEYAECDFSENLSLTINNEIAKKTMDKNKLKCNINIQKLFFSIKECVLTDKTESSIQDEIFIENFLINFKNNKKFRSKIVKLSVNDIPVEAKALFGNIKYDEDVDSYPVAPDNIPKAILENFLLKINYERQDLFAFTIQEFLKHINVLFDPETENFVQQFRHTKFEYKFSLKEVKVVDLTSYRNFLESIFYLFYTKTRNLTFLKYLVLFDDSTLEYSCLCIIKIISLSSMNDCVKVFKSIDTFNVEILRFLLKINTFVGKSVVDKNDILRYSLYARDFYSLIYCLESKATDNDLLQLSYFMIGDYVRVKGFNTASTMKNCSNFNLFFDFIISKNYNASRACLDKILQEASINDNNTTNNDRSYDKNDVITANQRNRFVYKILKEVVECNVDFEVETLISGNYTSHPGVIHHIVKDIELLSISSDLKKTTELISERREIADDSILILKIHKFLSSKIGIESFTKSVDQEIIKFHIRRKEYQRAEEEIAKFLLQKDLSALFTLAQIKIANKHLDEAKELLRRMQIQCKSTSIDYFRATTKLCEIFPSKAAFESSVINLEEILCEVVGESKEEGSDFHTQSNANCAVKNRKVLIKLEKIRKQLEIEQKRSIIHNNSSSEKECLTNPFTQTILTKPNMPHAIELLEHLQKLYFLTAKYFEKYSSIISIKYYFKSFLSNHEAIPRFFHLIASAHKNQFKIINEMVDTIVKEYLLYLIPFYKQISTKVALDNDASVFFKTIVSEMLEAFPYQTHWNSLFLYNSKKAEVVRFMITAVDKLTIDRKNLFLNIKNCSERLTLIAKSPAKTLSMQNFPGVRDLFPAQINVPGEMTEINNIKNEILIFRSLQCPKKITFVGENGKEYPMIVKYKDDLRKDSRFMDLDDLLNKLFDEGYYIRNYNVIPFTHESGIIEFVPNLINLKEIVTQVYKNIIETLQRFTKTKIIGGNNMYALQQSYLPVYSNYLKESYKDPYQFYKSRENYIKTYAIMNIVGWYMGLGDRHAENIHFDKLNGDTVHVDLNCIFEKGKTLEIAEKVPFRLTQNIVDGFGVLGLEGTYKQTMKYTLKVVKENRDVIQANLLSFVFDPLLEWSKKKTEPSKILEKLDLKLEFEDADHKIEELINEATDLNNLGGMYIGWMAFI